MEVAPSPCLTNERSRPMTCTNVEYPLRVLDALLRASLRYRSGRIRTAYSRLTCYSLVTVVALRDTPPHSHGRPPRSMPPGIARPLSRSQEQRSDRICRRTLGPTVRVRSPYSGRTLGAAAPSSRTAWLRRERQWPEGDWAVTELVVTAPRTVWSASGGVGVPRPGGRITAEEPRTAARGPTLELRRYGFGGGGPGFRGSPAGNQGMLYAVRRPCAATRPCR